MIALPRLELADDQRSRVTDRTGVVHVVTGQSATAAKTACGRSFALGRGGVRIWLLMPGHAHEICIICSRRKETS